MPIPYNFPPTNFPPTGEDEGNFAGMRTDKGTVPFPSPVVEDLRDDRVVHVPRREPSVPGPETKDTNPKDAIGIKKPPITTVPLTVLSEVGVGMLEGSLKYGRHNYRKAGVRASVYVDATWRHLMAFWEGEDIDPYSGLSHVTKAICSLVVLRDAMMNDMWTDDRPPIPKEFMKDLQAKVDKLLAEYPTPVPPYTKSS